MLTTDLIFKVYYFLIFEIIKNVLEYVDLKCVSVVQQSESVLYIYIYVSPLFFRFFFHDFLFLRKFSYESESHSLVSDSAAPWSIQSMELSRPEYWSG